MIFDSGQGTGRVVPSVVGNSRLTLGLISKDFLSSDDFLALILGPL